MRRWGQVREDRGESLKRGRDPALQAAIDHDIVETASEPSAVGLEAYAPLTQRVGHAQFDTGALVERLLAGASAAVD